MISERRENDYFKGVCISLGILAKMKEGAENVHTKLQAKAESVGLKPSTLDGKGQPCFSGKKN